MKKTTLKDIPSVDKILLELKRFKHIHHRYLKLLINKEIIRIRDEIKKGSYKKKSKDILMQIVDNILVLSSERLVNVINGTGIVLHTGLGRAPFNAKTLRDVANNIDGYVNLEINLNDVKRGDRQDHIREHICAICESESSLVVNNNAAAVMLTINQIAKGGEVIVSRGELVEIGGSFRIPDIIEASGAQLVEVGTTNRTHINDYAEAINKNTRLILSVHTSNYIIKGFTKSIQLNNLVRIGKKFDIPVMVDWGSGSFIKRKKQILPMDIPINTIMKDQPDIVTFSGDKLIGGPQSGIIVGNYRIIKQLQNNTLYRGFRCDKITISLLEKILRSYRLNAFTNENLTLKMLSTSRNRLLNRGKKIMSFIDKGKIKSLGISLVPSFVEAGSGSLPEDKIESIALIFNPRKFDCSKLARKFRVGDIPVVGYIKKNKFYIDLKAILPHQLKKLIQAINAV